MPDDERNVPRRIEMEDELDCRGRNTAQLFLYAIEHSGSGPKIEIMDLDDDRKGGVPAFLRAVKNQISVKFPFTRYTTIKEYTITNNAREIRWSLDEIKLLMETDAAVPICKVSVIPLLVFLHVDQGAFDNTEYTPFASIVSNARSLHEEHVKKVTDEMGKGESIVGQEDFAIVPYEVAIVDHPTREYHDPFQKYDYQCTLNRVPQSKVKVKTKTAVAVTVNGIHECYKRVCFTHASVWSDTIVVFNSLHVPLVPRFLD